MANLHIEIVRPNVISIMLTNRTITSLLLIMRNIEHDEFTFKSTIFPNHSSNIISSCKIDVVEALQIPKICVKTSR